ncbi:MAG: hypothetical protein JOZ77_10545 [Candidatus Eremiobacteraeota bacterium]|nr:hypothetical protein [Candidatus Eremiobacteraeota bacterium]
MKTFPRSALTISVAALLAAALLAGCSGSQPPISAPGVMPQTNISARSYKLLYRFHTLTGAHPRASLIEVNGTLYGTTEYGGTHKKGTVYSVSPSGAEKVLYSFAGADGANPRAGLVDLDGILYGTTVNGGAGSCGASLGGCGVVYNITTGGTEKVLHVFTGSPDGANPEASLIDFNGTLYGSTDLGGSGCASCGTVFSIGPSGKEKILHSFTGNSDGYMPQASLIAVKGTLYGTTIWGGPGCYPTGCGTIYSISPRGAEKVLYSFMGGSDGENASSGLVSVKGLLYGTTTGGGGTSCDFNIGCGTVYSVTTDGREKVLYSFTGGADGEYPDAGLIDVNGTLYGTTSYGGGSSCGAGCGTIYSVSTTGVEMVLHDFVRASDGLEPEAALLEVNGALYGTTETGGSGCRRLNHCGTVFTLSP